MIVWLYATLSGIHLTAQDSLYLAKVSSIDSIVYNLYDVISGDAGEMRNWDLFQYLFIPEATLMASGINREGKSAYAIISPAEYMTRNSTYLETNGFTEKELYRETRIFGTIAQVFSTYASYYKSTDQEPFDRGINSIELFYDQKRWWIVSIMWTSETEQNPIPRSFLPE